MFTVLSCEPVASESEFLRREMSCEWTQVSQDELVADVQGGKRVLLGVSEPEPYREILAAARPDSVILLMISDEAYTADRLALARSPAVRSVYRQYGVTGASTSDVVMQACNVAAGAPRAGMRPSIAGNLMSVGRATRARMRGWTRLGIPVTPIPLGYTASFAAAFAHRFACAPDASLLDAGIEDLMRPLPPRDVSVYFRGARGSAQRHVMLARAATRQNSRIEVIETNWSDPQREAEEYVTGLLSTVHALCPPGSINTETFRFYEALICGAIPIEPRTALTHLGRPVCRGDQPLERTRIALSSIRNQLRRDLGEDT